MVILAPVILGFLWVYPLKKWFFRFSLWWVQSEIWHRISIYRIHFGGVESKSFICTIRYSDCLTTCRSWEPCSSVEKKTTLQHVDFAWKKSWRGLAKIAYTNRVILPWFNAFFDVKSFVGGPNHGYFSKTKFWPKKRSIIWHVPGLKT